MELTQQAEKDFKELYQYGLVTERLAEEVFSKEGYVFLDSLLSGYLCSRVQVNNREVYFFPSLRTKAQKDFPDKNALRIEVTPFLALESLTLFPRYLDDFIEDTMTSIIPTEEYNVFAFSYQGVDEEDSVTVNVIYFASAAEIRLEPARDYSSNKIHFNLKALCARVFHHISSYFKNMRYDMLVMCPKSEASETHYVPFSSEFQSNTLHCQTCGKKVVVTGEQQKWLY